MSEKISGEVSVGVRIGGGVSTGSRLRATVAKGDNSLPVYTGEYEVIPKTYEETILPTKNRKLTANVEVKKIPQYEVSNDYGGETLIIGDEYYGG